MTFTIKKFSEMTVSEKQERKEALDKVFKHKFFASQVNYPPQNGFMEYGPVMTAVKNEIVNIWKNVVVDEDMFEVDTSVMVPYDVLKNSGHIDKFCDVVLTDGLITVRADHYIEENVGEWHKVPIILDDSVMERIDQLKVDIFKGKGDISTKLKNIKIKNNIKQFDKVVVDEICSLMECETKNIANLSNREIDFVVKVNNLRTDYAEFLPAKDFNLIFKLNDSQYLRPELAQGIFVDFKKVYDFNNGQMPFACFTVGKSYRNEISARGGMFRTKEFYQAEIEYFTEDGKHSEFKNILDEELLLLPNTFKTPIKMSVGEAFKQKIISSEAICVFLVRSKRFLIEIGIDIETVRSRQHHSNEMAHYAKDCWDVEINTLTGWIECAGIADRSNYDLTVHSKAINTNAKKCVEPKRVRELLIEKKKIIKELRNNFDDFVEYAESIPLDDDQEYVDVVYNGKTYKLKTVEKVIDSVNYIPTVIEPSFGISRIMYALVEQKFNFYEERKVLQLKPSLCYRHVVITSMHLDDFSRDKMEEIKRIIIKNGFKGVINKRNVSIGKRYLTCDEVGIPFVITVDKETNMNDTVTIRDRDTTEQVRVHIKEISNKLREIFDEKNK